MVPVRGRVAQPRPGRSGDGALISRAGKSKNPSETWEKLRWAACCARGPRWNCRAYSFVHSLGCGDEAASRKISHPALQAVDAHRTCGLVAGSAAGSGYLRALVHSASFSTLRLRVRFACGRRKDMYRRNHGCVPNGAAGPERITRDTMAFWLSTDGCQYEFRAGQIIMKGKSGVIKHLADHMIAMVRRQAWKIGFNQYREVSSLTESIPLADYKCRNNKF